MALPSWLLVFVGGRRSHCPGPSPTLGSFGPSHHWRYKSRVSLRGPPCACSVLGIPLERCATKHLSCWMKGQGDVWYALWNHRTTKVEAQICELLNEMTRRCLICNVKPYEPLRLKYKYVICCTKGQPIKYKSFKEVSNMILMRVSEGFFKKCN